MATDEAIANDFGPDEEQSTEIAATSSSIGNGSASSARKTPTIYTLMFVLSSIFLLIAALMMLNELLRFYPDLWRTDQYRP